MHALPGRGRRCGQLQAHHAAHPPLNVLVIVHSGVRGACGLSQHTAVVVVVGSSTAVDCWNPRRVACVTVTLVPSPRLLLAQAVSTRTNSKPFHHLNMNCDNFLGDKPSTRVRAPPGGRTSLDLFGGYTEPAPAAAPARAPLAPAPAYASFGSAAPAPYAAPVKAAPVAAAAAKPEGELACLR